MTRVNVHVQRRGDGPDVLLVHGDVATGSTGWSKQRPLADRWRLIVPDRPGAGRSPVVDRVDFAEEAQALAPLLGEGAHLVGHSYGGVVALEMAGAAPGLVHSLAVSEPPAYGLARGHPQVEATITALDDLWSSRSQDPKAFLARFAAIVGERPWPRPSLPEAVERGVRLLMGERPPWEAHPDLDLLRASGVSTLVISGGHSPAFEAVCDAVAAGTGGTRRILEGGTHALPRLGQPYNAALEAHWSACGPT